MKDWRDLIDELQTEVNALLSKINELRSSIRDELIEHMGDDR